MKNEQMPLQPLGTSGVEVTRLALGCMGLAGTWNPQEVGPENIRRATDSIQAALECGVTFFDHADIYGATACESVFKECLANLKVERERIFIATKCGIRAGYYDHSPGHIRASLDGSLQRLGTDYVDLYQLHRPDPLSHPRQTAEVLDELVVAGKIRFVGVSNYYPRQLAALRKYLRAPIVSNQIAISLLRLDPIYEGAAGGAGSVDSAGDGVLDGCLEHEITPLAYSPLGSGWLAGKREVPEDHPQRASIQGFLEKAGEMSEKYNGASPTQLALAWLLTHPAQIVPLVGSNNPAHIREAAPAAHIELERTDWYALWVAARGQRVP
jgi:predicted oxidoreductase